MRRMPDFLCFYRITISIILVFLGIHPWVPVLYSIALLSDLFDGFFYRHYTVKNPAKSFWPFKISPDPIADCLFVAGGLTYIVFYVSKDYRTTIIVVAAFLVCEILLGIVLTSVFHGTVGAIYITFLTHFACCKMLLATIGIWWLNSVYWKIHAIITIVVFYGIFIAIGDKSRLIRRR